MRKIMILHCGTFFNICVSCHPTLAKIQRQHLTSLTKVPGGSYKHKARLWHSASSLSNCLSKTFKNTGNAFGCALGTLNDTHTNKRSRYQRAVANAIRQMITFEKFTICKGPEALKKSYTNLLMSYNVKQLTFTHLYNYRNISWQNQLQQ